MRELRELSLDFRRLSSNLLTATHENANVQFARFKQYIDASPFISEKIQQKTDGIECDYNDCFVKERHQWGEIRIPSDERCHIKAMYDYMTQLHNDGADILGTAMGFLHSSKFDETIQNFMDKAFKPLIDFINDAISKEMIILEEEQRLSAPPITQTIGTVYGTVNQQGSGNITSSNTTNATSSELADLIAKLLPSLDAIQGVPQEAIDDVKDDLESIKEQLATTTPKKSRIQKALSGIKKFSSEFAMKLGVSLATGAITQADWITFIEQISFYVSNLG